MRYIVKIPTAILKIPESTQPETTFRLKGKGIPHLKGFGRGDQFVKVKVVFPKKLSGKEKKLLTEIAEIRGENKPVKNAMEFVQKFLKIPDFL